MKPAGRQKKKEAAPLKTQVLTLLLGTVLPIFIGMFIISAVQTSSLREQIYASSQDVLSTNMLLFDAELTNAASAMVGLDYSEDTLSLFESDDPAERYYGQNEYLNRLSQQFDSLISGYGVYCSKNDSLIYNFNESASLDYRHRQAFISLLRKDPETLAGGSWHTVSSEGFWYMVYSYRLRDSWFFCWTEVDYLMKITRDWLVTDNGGVTLLGSAGQPVAHSGDAVLSEDIDLPAEGYALSDGYIVFGRASSTGGYTIVEAVSTWELTRPVFWVQLAVSGVLVLFLAALQLLLHSLNRRFFTPMDQFQYAIGRVNKGILDYRIPEDHTSTEFHKLINSFNEMVAQIKDLKVQAYEDEIEKSRIRMQYMQVQIEPHFYLNALNTINAMAQVGDDELIQQLTRCLSDYMRFIASSRETVTIAEELTNIDNYLEIMKIRRGDSFIYEVRCEEQAKGVAIPPLLIQTLIENIMKYAFNAYGETRFSVDVHRLRLSGQNGIEITVEDNGAGYPPDYAARFNAGEYPDSGHIGLHNARMRLRYLYGEKTVFQLSCREDGGARTLIWFPADPKEAVK